ncbi:radical SAM protein [Tropicimonas sediminicola]|uniref:Iron-sulfur cluster-binding domain-containing protein n=1 Tax=Tropicimonas sediminicola TaxID=1031541 RepID=A0A239L9A5_9RHOB|nr:radical SAM protein [Tropicimonas sediminicola]SNT26895.1 Iron-sulfur cluster-binding domain-containing protein [Tropicimonas sediminicola]
MDQPIEQTAPATPDLQAAASVLRDYRARYKASARLTESDPAYVDPRACIRDAVARAEQAAEAETPALSAALWSALVERKGATEFDWTCAAFHALENDDFALAQSRAARALARVSNDLGAQAILHQAQRGGAADVGFTGRFCDAPFRTIETAPGGDVYFCCPAWLPKPIGNLGDDSAEAIWNSAAARDIRASIHDGSYRYCSRSHCPKLSGNSLPETTELTHARMAEIAQSEATALEDMPERLVLSHDRSCNLSCPTCRSELVLARKEEQKRLNALADRVLFPLMGRARRVRLTGSGDPFGSAHFQYVLRRLRDIENPNLKIDLQTNGVLLTPALWERLGLEGRVDQMLVSADAATPETYAELRRGATFDQLLRALDFIAELRRDNRIRVFRLDFVVQARNFREMPAFAELARSLGCDGVKFQMVRNWGTFTPEEFSAADIGRHDHPEHGAFRAVLEEPVLQSPGVEVWGLRL